jgi:enhancing lycopene biosynthesis protein 2
VLVESARIARGAISPLDQFRAEDFDAVLLPGGFGVAKNLCSWAFEGDNCRIDPGVEKALKAMHEAGKPIGALCIAPVIIGKLFPGSKVTTGDDPASAGFITKMGSSYTKASHGEVIVDKENKIFTTPCYMLDADIVQIAEGAGSIVKAMMEMM